MPLRVNFAQLPRIQLKPNHRAGVRRERDALESLETAQRVRLIRRRHQVQLRDFIAGAVAGVRDGDLSGQGLAGLDGFGREPEL